jgi:hypothetical protein
MTPVNDPWLKHDDDLSRKAGMTEPGMAYFAGTGPAGKFCGDCKFWTYQREQGRRNRDGHYESYLGSYPGCAKFKQFTGHHGPPIDRRLHACKYFEEKK